MWYLVLPTTVLSGYILQVFVLSFFSEKITNSHDNAVFKTITTNILVEAIIMGFLLVLVSPEFQLAVSKDPDENYCI